MGDPLVSICIPTYNRAASLRESLPRICQQTYAPLEILISDNGSTDETEAVGRQAAAGDSRIRYIRHPRNIGLYGNHNFCIDQSRGEFVSFCHDHDEHDSKMVQEFADFLRRHPDVGVVSSDWELIDETGCSLGVRGHPVEDVTPGLVYIAQTMKSGRSSVGVPGALIRRAALGKIRFHEQRPIGFGDFVVWCEMAERWQIGHVKKRLWRWRQHRHSQSARTIESLTRDYDVNMNAFCDDHLSRWPAHARLVAGWRRSIRQYLFWALAYEVGLYFRSEDVRNARRVSSRTLFEILDYRLTEEEFQRVLQHLRTYRTGVSQQAVCTLINTLIRCRMTWPLVWATNYNGSFRALLGLQ